MFQVIRSRVSGTSTLRYLARVQRGAATSLDVERDPGEGLGMVVAVTGTRGTPGWRATLALVDPTLTPVCVTTDEPPRGGLVVAARTDEEFLQSWSTLTGRGRLDLVRDREPSAFERQPA